jgi:D-3-phosphoglycerate dehydrogenase
MSPRPVVCVLEPIDPAATAWLAERADVAGPDDPRCADWPAHADAVVSRIRRIAPEDVARAARLKAIAKHGVGVDNIPLDAARAAGVRVTNTPNANTNATAELTLALALAAARRIPRAAAGLLAGRPVPERELIGPELAGRTVGIAGLGRIGSRVAGMFRHGLGCEVLAWSPTAPDSRFAAAGAERVGTLVELARRSDLLTVHVTLNASTRGLVGEQALSAMRPGAILVNAARGGVVDEAALFRALRDGPLSAAASDVFETEPPTADHPLLTLPNFVATPHIGAATPEAMRAMGMHSAAAAIAVLEGRIDEPGAPWGIVV